MNANDARDMNVFSNASVATVLGIIIVYALLLLLLLLCSCPLSRLPPCTDNAMMFAFVFTVSVRYAQRFQRVVEAFLA